MQNDTIKKLTSKNVLLGISAGIAAYKTPDLVRKLIAQGANVQVILTKNAEQFVAPLALQAVSGNSVHNFAMTAESESGMGHIDLARWADIILIAPATANIIARLCQGIADELLTTVCVATRAPIAVAPAMNQQMWQNQATVDNLKLLSNRGAHILGPDSGDQACGEVGLGRMLEPLDLASQLGDIFSNTQLTGKSIMITAGPTWEALDPVRGITNHSSGLMGYALAQAAIEAGAKVTLVSGPTHLDKPAKTTNIDVISAQDMYEAVMRNIEDCDIFIGVAAVADYRPVETVNKKIKKDASTMNIELVKNKDILAEVAALKNPPYCVGFAAETDNLLDYARSKLKKKKLQLIAANQVGGNKTGFKTAQNAISLISSDSVIELPLQSKHALARNLVVEIGNHYSKFTNLSNK